MARLSVELAQLFFEGDLEADLERSVTLGQVLEISRERVFGVFMVLLSLPSALPIPAPGYSTPFALVLLLLSTQLVIGAKSPWLPPKMLLQELNHPKLRPLWRRGLNWLGRLEILARPRWSLICTSGLGRGVLGILISLMAISMLIPIPATNTLPAMGIFITSFGLIEEDGLICLLGMGVCLLGAAVSTSVILALIYGGSSLVDWLREQI